MRRASPPLAVFAAVLLYSSSRTQALLGIAPPAAASSKKNDPTFRQPDVVGAGISEELCIDTANRMQRAKVPVSTSVHPSGEVGISYAYWPAPATTGLPPPVFLVHGFDSSCLEFRRLGSRLASKGVNTYAVDLLGWGYTDLEGVKDFGAAAKVEALQSFINTFLPAGKQEFCVVGASLGGAAAIETALAENCQGLILIDAQGFVDGIGPMAAMPRPLAWAGVQVLKSIPLRSSANQMSYYDKTTFATDEAVTVGRLHCTEQRQWADALVNFMQSGGFAPSSKVPLVKAPALVLWGRQDEILDGREFAPKFLDALPNARLHWIEDCGHVPHLEQPE